MNSNVVTANGLPQSIEVIDSHTAGEPTRVVIEGGPPLQGETLAEMRTQFQQEFDHFRRAIINEPRGSDVLVGALLTPPLHPDAIAGVIFFNNVGMLGMCGHGLIGLIATLKHLGRITPGTHSLNTPVGLVQATLKENGEVSISNVVSYRALHNICVDVPDVGKVWGDVAWGGNWFFLTRTIENSHWSSMCDDLKRTQTDQLLWLSTRIREAVNQQAHAEVDHVELFGTPINANSNSRNFVLCPGGMYDRSPCGTGTSAKLACLAADGKLKPGEQWRQESILGTQFLGEFRWANQAEQKIHPTICSRAFVTGKATLLLNAEDPFCWGIEK